LIPFGNREPDVPSSIASRLARLERHLTPEDRRSAPKRHTSQPLSPIAGEIVAALNSDPHMEMAKPINGGAEPTEEQIGHASSSSMMRQDIFDG
jgi:hypothetical protein